MARSRRTKRKAAGGAPSEAAAPAPGGEPGAEAATAPREARLHWPLWGSLLAMAAMLLGWNWDISWHRSIGRDTLWTWPHLSIYAALIVAFAVNASLVLSHTFGPRRGEPGLKVLGFRGPTGSFVTLWGILIQFAAILFDAWWHDVYGLDLAFATPPHMYLGLGVGFFYAGQVIVLGRYLNDVGARRPELRPAFLVAAALILGHFSLGVDAAYGPPAYRGIAILVSGATIFPGALLLPAAYLGRPRATVIAAAIFTAMIVLMMQVFMLFPARAQFGPVYHELDFLLPPPFPMLLIVPALAFAGLMALGRKRPWLDSPPVLGAVFVVLLVLVNLGLSHFLQSPLGANRLFAGHLPGSVFEADLRPLRELAWNSATFIAFALALVLAPISAWAGRSAGRWLRTVVR